MPAVQTRRRRFDTLVVDPRGGEQAIDGDRAAPHAP